MFRKIFALFYGFLGFFWFWLILLILYPFFMYVMYDPKRHKQAFWLNRIWARVVYALMFAKVEIEMRFQPNKNQVYIYCPNHTSYLDISLMCYAAPEFVKFVGKSALLKIPLFGHMFRHLHIAVNRKDSKSRYASYQKAKEALLNGISVCIFPEGGIYSKQPPVMVPFKDGAFRLAIELRVPIVPVTIPHHWKMLPGISPFLYWHKIKIIFHEPISTNDMTLQHTEQLKQQTFNIITEELKKYYPERFHHISSTL
ncbi:MAG: 1-acyl-sn-glycerol-3-phosphate acyltransferase [Cytophagales bacterium]|nr:1-acyl-sn-glycerol-3-phosphate acyltransferase [Cytophagales bacterium]MDW8383709.1 lysophospholipid acyltransferase family protein [Flammeovirgaceae bacterium]